jgi:hypothetical protein
MREVDDWRLTNQDRYLKGAVLRWQSYASSGASNDHDHCEFCSSKFMVDGSSDTLHEGYATEDRYRWICKPCFEDFRDLFQWKVSDIV